MKLVVFCLLAVLVGAKANEEEEKLACNFRICGVELLHFDGFSISNLFRKIELANFCIKECTPPVVREFFQSITYSLTKRIPGHCSKEACVEKNRFVALAKCINEKAWPLLQCSKRLVDLAQVILQEHPPKQKVNYTCSIVVETTLCFEEILQECGPRPFGLVKEIAGDVIKLGISTYCPKSHRNDFFQDIERTTTLQPFEQRKREYTEISTVPGPKPYPMFVKGYRSGNTASASATVSMACIVSSVVLSGVYMLRFR